MTRREAYDLGIRPEDIWIGNYSGEYEDEWVIYYMQKDIRRVIFRGNIYDTHQWFHWFKNGSLS